MLALEGDPEHQPALQGGEKTDFSWVHSSALPTHGLRN